MCNNFLNFDLCEDAGDGHRNENLYIIMSADFVISIGESFNGFKSCLLRLVSPKQSNTAIMGNQFDCRLNFGKQNILVDNYCLTKDFKWKQY